VLGAIDGGVPFDFAPEVSRGSKSGRAIGPRSSAELGFHVFLFQRPDIFINLLRSLWKTSLCSRLSPRTRARFSAGVYPHGGHFLMTILGLDPGAHGAIAILDEDGGLIAVHDMPSTSEANGRTATNAPLLAAILARTNARVAFCEFVGARPTDAKVAAFAFGRARGVIEGVVGALGLPISFIAPAAWKRIADIPPGVENKDLARTRAIARWPTRADLFARKMDVDRAEACLIAIAGMRREAAR
jgi:crossover junction endodeoxyribonuclease RuvC